MIVLQRWNQLKRRNQSPASRDPRRSIVHSNCRPRLRRLLGESLEDRRVLASYVVDTELDVVAEDGMLSLREAVQASNANTAINADTVAGDAGPGVTDTITFASGLSLITLGSDLAISDSLSIALGDATDLTLDADNQSRIFSVQGGLTGTQVSISGLTLTAGLSDVGGAVYVDSDQSVSLDDVTLMNNTATGEGGGAIYSLGTLSVVDSTIQGNIANGTSGSGGGIFNAGIANITGTTFSNNTANRAGGGIEGGAESVTALDTVILSGNVAGPVGSAAPGNGGGLHLTGEATATVIGGMVTSNTAASEGGGLWNGSGTMLISGTTISGNTASGDDPDNGGGGVFNAGGTVSISEATISDNVADGAAGSGGGIFNDGGTLDVDLTEITGNTAVRAGGGIESNGEAENTLDNITLSGNAAGTIDAAAPGNGGGLHVTGDGNVTVISGDVMNNTAASEGGGLWNGTGTMTIDGTTLIGNTASGDESDNGGGAVFNAGGTVSINDATMSDNVADGTAGSGGGILNDGGMLTVTATTIADNVANRAGGGIEATAESQTDLLNVTLAANVAGPNGSAAPGNGGGLHISGNGSASITGGTVSSNHAASEGGGLWNSVGTMTITGTTISGNTASGDEVDNGGGGLFNAGGTLEINAATISNNVADGTGGSGGGVFNDQGSLTITKTTISDNTANRAGGGIEATADSGTSLSGVVLVSNIAGPDGSAMPGNGGGLHITGDGSATITGSQIFANTAASEGGGLWNGGGTMTISSTTLAGNTASGADATNGGGAVFNAGGTVEITDATIRDNQADGTAGSGGGIFNDGGDLVVDGDSTIARNRANRAGGGIEATAGSSTSLMGVLLQSNIAGEGSSAAPGNGGGLHITGNGSATIANGTVSNNQAASEGGGLWNGSGTMTIDGTTISDNTASGGEATNGGGGVFNAGGTVTIINATISDNVADGSSGSGGGIFNDEGTVTLTLSEVTNNSANRAGGGIEVTRSSRTNLASVVLAGNTAGPSGSAAPGNGGGLHISGSAEVLILISEVLDNFAANEGGGLWNSAEGALTVGSSTIANNSSGDGGGVFNDGDAGNLLLTNSTIANNQASDAGGGINSEGAIVTLSSVTVAGNDAETGGGVFASGGTVSTNNSIIGDNTASTAPDFGGPLTSGGFNLIGDTSGTTLVSTQTSDLLNVDPGLENLQDNGGPTPTIALSPLSPALDAGNSSGLDIDQRGVSRPQGPANDIGAFESDLAAPAAANLSISASDAEKAEGDSGLTEFRFTVTRTGNVDNLLAVNFSVTGSGTGESAADEDDFGGVFPSGTIFFGPGETSETITINVTGDQTIEPDNRFTVTLSDPGLPGTIVNASSDGIILDDDEPLPETRILVPQTVVRTHLVPGDSIPTAILFRALADTTVTVTPVGLADFNETITILDGNTQPISSLIEGVTQANVSAGEMYAVIFQPQTISRQYAIDSTAGAGSLSNAPSTNILQPTDTSGNGSTTAQDALLVINSIQRNTIGAEGEQTSANLSAFLDVNRDERINARDALIIINHLTKSSLNAGEGEFVAASQNHTTAPLLDLSTSSRDEAFAEASFEEQNDVTDFVSNHSDTTFTAEFVDDALAPEADEESPVGEPLVTDVYLLLTEA